MVTKFGVLIAIALCCCWAHTSGASDQAPDSALKRVDAIHASLGSHHRGFQTLETGAIRSMLVERQQLLRGLVRGGHVQSAFERIPMAPQALHRAMRALDGGSAVEEVFQTWVQLGRYSDNDLLSLPYHVYPATRDDVRGVTRLHADNTSLMVTSEAYLSHEATPVRIADLGEGVRAVCDTFLHPVTKEEFLAHPYTEVVNHCPEGNNDDLVYGEHDNIGYIYCDVHHRSLHRPARKFHPSQVSETGFQFIPTSSKGTMRTLVLPVDFSDNVGYPVPGGPEFLLNFYGANGELDRFFNDNSESQFRTTATLAPLIRAPRPSANYTATNTYLDKCLDEALQIANTLGFTPKDYDQWVLVTKYMPLGYAGMSYIGSAGSHTNLQYTYIHATAHEYGHSLGRVHAHLKSPYSDFGNTLDIMGYAYSNVNPHYGARNKLALKWLDTDLHVLQVQRTSGVYRLYCHDHPGSFGPRLIQLGYLHQTRAFWLEYRQFNGFGTIGNATWPYPKSLIQPGQALVQGALLLEDLTSLSGSGDSTLIDASQHTITTTNGRQVDATIAVGVTYNIGQDGDPAKPSFCQVKVLAAGGADQDSYLDIQLTFGATPLCPFPTKYPKEACELLCSYNPFVVSNTLVYFLGSERAWNFVVPTNQAWIGISSIDFQIRWGNMTNIVVKIMSNVNNLPGAVLATATYSTVLVPTPTTSRLTMGNNDALNTLQLSAGMYWLTFTAVQSGATQPALFCTSNIADGIPSYRKSGTSWITDSVGLREVAINLNAKCNNLQHAPTKLVVREIPTNVNPNERFYVTVQYQDENDVPVKLSSGRTVTASLYKITGTSTLTGILTASMTVYSSAVTFPKLILNAAGSYQLDITDGTLTVRSSVIVVLVPSYTIRFTASNPQGFSDVGQISSVNQGDAFTPFSIELVNSNGAVETSNNALVITATTSMGSLASSSVTVVNGVATFSTLSLTGCITGTAVLTFTAGTQGSTAAAGKTVVTGAVTQVPVPNVNIVFSTSGSVFTAAGQSSSAKHGTAMGSIVVRMTDSCGNLDTSNSGVVITATSTSAIAGATATMSAGVATFSSLAFTTCMGSALTFTAGSQGTQAVSGKQLKTGVVTVTGRPNADMQFAPSGSLFTNVGQTASVMSFTAMGKIVVQMLDSCGATDTSHSGSTVTVASSASGTLSGASATFTNGVATFSSLTFTNTPSSPTLTFTAAPGSGLEVASNTLTTGILSVRAANSYSMRFLATNSNGFTIEGQASSISSPVAFPSLVLENLNSDGLFDSSNSQTIITATASSGTLSGSTATMVNGVATFSALKFSTCPSTSGYIAYLTFTAGGQGGLPIGGKTLFTGAVTVVPVSATSIRFGTPLATPITRGAVVPTFTIEVLNSCNEIDTTVTTSGVVHAQHHAPHHFMPQEDGNVPIHSDSHETASREEKVLIQQPLGGQPSQEVPMKMVVTVAGVVAAVLFGAVHSRMGASEYKRLNNNKSNEKRSSEKKHKPKVTPKSGTESSSETDGSRKSLRGSTSCKVSMPHTPSGPSVPNSPKSGVESSGEKDIGRKRNNNNHMSTLIRVVPVPTTPKSGADISPRSDGGGILKRQSSFTKSSVPNTPKSGMESGISVPSTPEGGLRQLRRVSSSRLSMTPTGSVPNSPRTVLTNIIEADQKGKRHSGKFGSISTMKS